MKISLFIFQEKVKYNYFWQSINTSLIKQFQFRDEQNGG